MMTVLRQQAVQLVQQIPEDQMPNIIQYLHSLVRKVGIDHSFESKSAIPPKMKVLGELKEMIRPVPELDYKKELEDARDEKYGRSD